MNPIMLSRRGRTYEENVIKRYNDRLSLYGYSPKSLGWIKGRQTVRFKVLSEIGELENSSVLDIGCGFGDLFHFFKKTGKSVRYTGYDINQNFVEIARKNHPDAKFILGNFLEENFKDKYDWVFASGVFEFKYPNMLDFVRRMMSRMFEASRKGIAADFMTSYVDFHGGREGYYARPEQIFGIGKAMSRRVTLRHDYMPYEFCIYVYKDAKINARNVFARIDQQIKQELGTAEFFRVSE